MRDGLARDDDRRGREGDPPLQGGGHAATSRLTSITVEKGAGGKPVIEASPSTAGPSAASSLGGLATADPSRGYREELEHFAYCIRHGDASNYHDDKDHQPRCRGEVALADAVIALTSNLAMKQKRRIEFDERWFDYTVARGPRRFRARDRQAILTRPPSCPGQGDDRSHGTVMPRGPADSPVPGDPFGTPP